MKITTKQSIEFNMARHKLLESISIFEESVKFVESKCNCEVKDKDWIEILKHKVGELNVEDLRKMSGVECGYRIEKHISGIEKLILQEFSMMIPPFDKILSKYRDDLFIIFILKNIKQ